MQLTTLFLLAAFLQVSARGISQQVNYRAKNEKIQNAFAAIEKQTGYVFFYRAQDLSQAKQIDVDINETNLAAALEKLLKNQPLQFRIEGKTVFITSKKPNSVPNGNTAETELAPAPITVHGKLTNENGEPLIGVTISIKGSKAIGSTDGKGEFTLTLPDANVTLVFSAVTIETYEVKLNGRTELALSAKTKISQLEDVELVSKGYYSVKQRLNTGNVSTVKGSDIQKQPVSDPILALEGRVPGMFISQTSGVPGAGYTIMIRGRNSLAQGNEPFYIVDGVPFVSTSITNEATSGGAVGYGGYNSAAQGMSPFNTLNPSDIESIEVLKDADATAIYGSRGANGVVLITTKKGKNGATKFDFNVYSGAGKVASQLPMLNTQQYLALRRKTFANDGVAPKPSDYDVNGTWDTTRYTNWQDVLIGGTAKFTSAQASISGGNANTQFIVSGGYTRQTTVYPGDFDDRKASLHFNLNHTSADQRFRATLSAQYLNDRNILPLLDLTTAFTLAPDAPSIYDANGNLNWASNTWANNPYASVLQPCKSVSDNLSSNMILSYQIIPGLQVKSSFGYTHLQMNQTDITPSTSQRPPDNTNPYNRSNSFATNDFTTWIIEPQLNYTRQIAKGTLDILVGTTIQQNKQSSLGQNAYNFSSDAQISNVAAAATVYVTSNKVNEYRHNAVYARIGYNWEDKYIVNATARRDGSSRFGPNNKFGDFGSAGAAWIFSKEKFISNALKFLSFGKIRASYGATGNDQIADYQYLNTYSVYSGGSGVYQGTSTLYPTQIANPYFGWETVKKLEGGIELGFLRERVLFSASYYRNRTGNQLVGQPLPTTSGFTYIQSNLPAVVQNTGFEFVVATTNISRKSFSWSSSLNLTVPRNKLVAFPGLSSNPSYSNRFVIGQPLSISQLFRFTGVNPQTGIYTFEDVNKDGVINNSDKQFLSSSFVGQEFYGGFNNSLSYKGIELSFLFQFVKQTGNRLGNKTGRPGGFNANQPAYILNAWQQPGDIAEYQKYTQTGGTVATALTNFWNSDYTVTDASFIRLKNVSLSYTIPATWQKRLHLQNARIYLQAQNLLTITKYQGLDPETQGLNLPPLRMITAGLQITL